LQNNIEIDNHSIRATCSLGVAVYPDHAQTVAELLAGADTAMYAAKRQGKNQSSICAEPRDSHIHSRR
jgi:diguanylate cyclase (GGDEF)-like protein